MPLRVLPVQELSRSLRIPGATQWGSGDTPRDPGAHPLNASRRLHRSTLPLWAGGAEGANVDGGAARLAPGAAVFAMGSCFAREVERVLGLRGFPILSEWGEAGLSPVRGGEGVGGEDPAVANRYNAATMLLEVRRLLEGPEALPDGALLVEEGGGWVDAHYHGRAPMPREALLSRRRRLHAAFQSLRDADAVILTLGLNEAGFDVASGLYRNWSPSVAEIRRGAAVEVHSLTVAENVACLEGIAALVRRHCRRNPLLVLTVSPVPLTLTFQRRDAIVANSEGKAILRAAAAEFCAAHPEAAYFPSYEMALNADPKAVWKGDKRHLHKAFVATIVDAFVERHCAATEPAT